MNHLQLNEYQRYALDKLTFTTLTLMQEATLQTARAAKGVILLSPTGTGKTLAYLLPLIEKLESDAKGVQAMVVVPSRELAIQIETVLKIMNLPWKPMSVYGGRSAMDEHRTMKGLQPAIIIGTPGRLNDHLGKGNINASTITTLVIDEFDKCLELGFQEEMQQVVSQLPAVKHRFLTSATDMDELPDFTSMHDAVKLDYLAAIEHKDKVDTFIVHSESKDKLRTLYKLLCTLDRGQSIVFCNHRESVDRVEGYLREQRLYAEAYHGGMEQELRERALYKFRCGSSNVLVSTDLAARGLDIPGVRHIIHYHLPDSEDSYIHRTGRTARWNAEGSSFLILHSEEHIPEYLFEKAVDYPLPERVGRPASPVWTTLYIGKGKKDKISRMDIAGFLYKKGGLERSDVGIIDVHDYYAYVSVASSKVRQLLTLVSGEKIKGMKTRIEIAR